MMLDCDHRRPVFGCDGCVNRDKREMLKRAINTTSAPPCPKCGGRTVYIESSFAHMTLTFACKSYDGGTQPCDGEVEVKVGR